MKTFLIWWVFILLLGTSFMPFTGLFFRKFEDRGWLFSKVLGLAVSGFLTWILVCSGLMSFSMTTCTIAAGICILGNLALIYWIRKRETERLVFKKEQLRIIILEEFIFLLVFCIWTYLAGFHPAAYGTEKFMDYGFMAAMMRSKTLPAPDLWYAGSHMNYYYGGQYYAVFFTKLTGTDIAETYNVMRTLIAAFAFVLPFSLVHQLCQDHLKSNQKGKSALSASTGLLAGAAVSLCGNMHYVIIGKLQPFLQKLLSLPTGDYTYWFPNSTRYIGHYPEAGDRTIHEFPCYSFILGDLHAHVVNVMFVLTVVGILYAWIREFENSFGTPEKKGIRKICDRYILILGFFIGIFQWMNYWDFLIYFVVTGAVILYRNIRQYQGMKILLNTALQSVAVLLAAGAAGCLFTLQFDSMVSGVALVWNHSKLYQLAVLWALPVLLSVIFIAGIIIIYGKRRAVKETGKFRAFFHAVPKPDIFVVILSICALGLILIPELVYVRDIYEKTSARANTMFKLTYQAYILFGICMAYILFRLLKAHKRAARAVGKVGLICLLATLGYFPNAVNGWFGDIVDSSRYQGLNATAFLETDFTEDAQGIRWLNEHITGSPVVLEANGDSYSDFERVSAMTGLPTVLGWYVHEWLWRGDTEQLNVRAADIETIYTSQERETVEELLKEYQVSYVFVGKQEREKYEELNHELIRDLGDIVFESEGAYIIAISG